MKSTIKLSGLIYFLQIIQIPSGCNTELLQINVQNQVNCRASIFIFLVGPKWRRTSIYGFLDGLERRPSRHTEQHRTERHYTKNHLEIVVEAKRVGNKSHKRDKTHTIKENILRCAKKLNKHVKKSITKQWQTNKRSSALPLLLLFSLD